VLITAESQTVTLGTWLGMSINTPARFAVVPRRCGFVEGAVAALPI
jgi:hypothetical protein